MTNPPRASWGLYIHLPFCPQRCTYCDFPIRVGGSPATVARYLRAVAAEWWGETLPSGRLISIYLGGGTPSLIEPAEIARLLEAIGARTVVGPQVEITLEVNPGTVSPDRLAAYRQSGVNRLSIGAQAGQADHLARLGRTHGPEDIERTVAWARHAGFHNLSLDAIYGLPQQTIEQWQATLDMLVGFHPEHLSLYQLQVEPGTILAQQMARGTVALPDADQTADMADWALDRLEAGGLKRYETSNFAKPGYRSRHNRLYWRFIPYLALGMGAHAFWQGRRWWNRRGLEAYCASALAGEDPVAGEENVTGDEAMRQFLWLGLREMDGVGRYRFRNHFGQDPLAVFPEVLTDFVAKGLLEATPGRLRLTRRGHDMANWIARALLDATPAQAGGSYALPPQSYLIP